MEAAHTIKASQTVLLAGNQRIWGYLPVNACAQTNIIGEFLERIQTITEDVISVGRVEARRLESSGVAIAASRNIHRVAGIKRHLG